MARGRFGKWCRYCTAPRCDCEDCETMETPSRFEGEIEKVLEDDNNGS